MKKINLKKILGIAALCLGLNQITLAQCNAGYTYTVGSAGSVAFTNTSTGSPSYYWSFGDGTSSSVTSPTHVFQYNGTYFVNLSIGDTLNGICDSTSQSITITNGLTCNIAASFSYSAGSNGEINFTNTSANVPGGAVYSWSFGENNNNNNSSNQASPSHVYYYNGTYSVYLSVSDSLGHCSNSTVQTVTVSNGNVCSLSVNYTYTVGSNGQVSFTNTSTGSDTSAIVNWSFGDNAGTYNQQSPSHTYAYNGTYYVSLAVGDSMSNCHGTRVDTITITNTSNAPICGASFYSNADSLQGGGAVNFTNSSWGTTSQTLYNWSFGDGTNSTLQNPTHTYAYNGTYGVTLSISDSSTGCSSTYSTSVVISNGGTAPCVASVTFNMHQDSLNPQPGVWEVSTYYSSQVTGAVWSWGDGTSTSGFSPAHTYTAAGQYNICVMAYASCGDSSFVCQNDSLWRLAHGGANGTNSVISVTVINVNGNSAGIKTAANETAQVSLYPNPSAGVFTLSLTNVAATKAQINITNILGEVVYSTQESVNSGSISKEIDMQSTANGAYFMKVMVGDKSYTNKIIINK